MLLNYQAGRSGYQASVKLPSPARAPCISKWEHNSESRWNKRLGKTVAQRTSCVRPLGEGTLSLQEAQDAHLDFLQAGEKCKAIILK